MKKLVFAALLAAFSVGCSDDKPVLQVYSWSDYVSDVVISEFEQKYNCSVKISSFDSNEAMYAKLKAGAAGYDVIVPSSYQVEMLVSEGMLEKLDHSKLQNVKKNFDRRYEKQVLDPEMNYSVPYVITYTGFLYRKDCLPEDADPNSWSLFGHAGLKGRISFLDDIREVIGAGLMYNGYSINSESQAEIDKAVETVLAWKTNIRKFDAESYKTEVVNKSSYAGHGYSSDSAQAMRNEDGSFREDLGFAYPKEGFCVAFDELAILKTARNKDLAYKFIDFLYETENAVENMNYVCGVMPHAEAIGFLQPEFRALLIPPKETMQKGQLLRSVAGKQEVSEMYNKAWDRIKSMK